jgi:hypothetical protein
MSKRTSYGKNYHSEVRFIWTSVDDVRTSARVLVYPANAILLASGFLPSADAVKTASTRTIQRVRAGAGPRGHASHGHRPTWTRLSFRGDAGLGGQSF